MAKNVLVFVEHLDGKLKKVSLEAVCQGQRVAEKIQATVTAVVIGTSETLNASLFKDLARYGADRVIAGKNPDLAESMPDALTNILCTCIADQAPALIIMGGTTRGREIASRLCTRMEAPLAMDCLDITLDGNDLVFTRPVYGGKVLSTLKFKQSPGIAVVRTGSIKLIENPKELNLTELDVEMGKTDLTFISKSVDTSKIDLTEADTVIAGGFGTGGKANALLEELANAFGGAVGASRGAVDEGWHPIAEQVGQTGKVVSPTLYVACGISGAIQHLAGMNSSRMVVAINKDPDAPIFSEADLGIVDNLFDILPILTDKIKTIKANG
ncbi:EtfA3 [Desulforapulum autotrophicum HRM2]|uniref:EtfA3 n=1 Tax=Desulforapulum autotrophicum (strain ATCC 43914 / DSM 3382 / VKM B-1955 / HRM2) TaxID=177437 RepID=C0QAX1_DESAH|nr:electron transfer flavoprotein subunit alpha/FixB family protein [Desulforapulum autotrophicum]ACN16904.1 EtfA3 [Desulforapulum autotrophicum HRM2]